MDRLRKYGLDYCDLPTMLQNLDFMLRFMILRVDVRNQKSTPIINNVAFLFLTAVFVYVYMISSFWFVFVRGFESGELHCAVVVFSLGITCHGVLSKLIFMHIYQKSIKKIVAGYLAVDSSVVPGSRFANTMLDTLRVVKRRAVVFWLVVVLNGILYVLIALFKPGRHMMEDCFIFYGLEPMFESPNYEIAFPANLCGVFICVYLPANITGLMIVLVGYTEAQMLALSEKLTNLWEDAEQYYQQHAEELSADKNTRSNVKEKRMNEYIEDHLKEIVRIHSTNINLLSQIEEVSREAVASEFFFVVLGLIADLLGDLTKTYIELPFSMLLIWMDCLIGQRVADASEVFEKAVYDSKWENFNVANRKIVSMMLRISQKNLSLSAGGLKKLNFATFMMFIRTIYSAYNTLRVTMK